MSDRWCVGAILKEPIDITLGFVAWYLDQGADHVYLFFDDPGDPAIAVLSDHRNITCTPCTPEFWRSIRINPKAPFVKRQNRALTHLYGQLTDGWLLNVDADELLYVQDGKIGDLIADVGPEVQAIRVLPAELVQTDDPAPGRHFRMPMPREGVDAVYGRDFKFFLHREGLVGHHQGKSLTRAGIKGARVRQHWAEMPEGTERAERVIGRARGAYLLHLFERGFESWKSKVHWRISARGFRARISGSIQRIEARDEGDADLRNLYQRLHHMDDDALERLRQQDAHLYLELGLDEIARKHFPNS